VQTYTALRLSLDIFALLSPNFVRIHRAIWKIFDIYETSKSSVTSSTTYLFPVGTQCLRHAWHHCVDKQNVIKRRSSFNKNSQVEKGYGARKIMTEFPGRNWLLASVNCMVRQIDTTGSAEHKSGSGRPRTACFDQNVDVVEVIFVWALAEWFMTMNIHSYSCLL